jgi:hypothetical protein
MGRITQLLSGLSPFAASKKSIEITVETNETWNFHWFRQTRSELCPICGAETIFIPVDLGEKVVRADIRFIDELIEGGQVHFDTAAKEDLLCLSSLRRSMEKYST